MTVVECVAAIVAAYQDGGDLLKSVKDRRRVNTVPSDPQEDKSMKDLEISLARGSDVVQGQYDRDSKKLGAPFATGDGIAETILDDILEDMKSQIIFRLSSAWQKKSSRIEEFLLLQDVSDESQDRAIMCLMQLHQRILVNAPIKAVMPPPKDVAAPTDAKIAPSEPIDQPSHQVDDSSKNKLSYIEPEPTARLILQSYKEAFANNIVASAPYDEPPETLPNTHFDPKASWSKSANSIEPRIQHASSMTSVSVPIEYRGDDVYQEARRDEQFSAYHDVPLRHDRKFIDSPTLSPARMSSSSTVSSRGSISPNDPEWNPWSEFKGSPLSSVQGSSPLDSDCRQSLVPDALNTRRSRDSHATDHSHISRNTSHSRSTDQSRYTNYSGSTSSSRNTAYSRNTDYSRNTEYSRNAEQPRDISAHRYPSGSKAEKPRGSYDKYDSVYEEGQSIAAPWAFDDASVYSRGSSSHSPARTGSPQYEYNQFLRSTLRQNSQKEPRPYTSNQGSGSRQVSYYEAHLPGSHGTSSSKHGSPPKTYNSNPVSVFRQPSQAETQFRNGHSASRSRDGSSYEASIRSDDSLQKSPSHGWLSGRSHGRLSERIPAPIQEVQRQPPKVPDRAAYRPMPPLPYGSIAAGSDPSTSGSTIILPPVTPTSVRSGMSFQTSRISISTNASSTSGVTPMPQPATRVVPPVIAGNIKQYLPSESNKFAGFCKGAWRAQIGEKKKTYEERVRPAALYSKNNTYYKCQKCAFEGRAIKMPGVKKTSIDTKVYGSHGILYRWEFLYKSHVHLKSPLTNPLDSHFGCVFCCAAGKGTPIFGGVASLLAHLQEHRDVLPDGEVLFRMNAVVGRSPDPEEDFDVALPAFVI